MVLADNTLVEIESCTVASDRSHETAPRQWGWPETGLQPSREELAGIAEAIGVAAPVEGSSDRVARCAPSTEAHPAADPQRAIGVFEWIFDLVPLGILVLHHDRTLVMANKSARSLLAAKDGLAVDTRGRCQPVLLDARRQFVERLAKVFGGCPEDPGASQYVKLPRDDGRTPLLTRIVRLPDGDVPSACVLIRDAGATCGPSVAALRQLFSLTPAEARLACALANGFTIDEYSCAMGVTRNTTRTQVASVLGKTETRRQADLIRAIAGLG